MAVTVIEALMNAQANMNTLATMGMNSNPVFMIAQSQLDNAIGALEEGKDIDDELPED